MVTDKTAPEQEAALICPASRKPCARPEWCNRSYCANRGAGAEQALAIGAESLRLAEKLDAQPKGTRPLKERLVRTILSRWETDNDYTLSMLIEDMRAALSVPCRLDTDQAGSDATHNFLDRAA